MSEITASVSPLKTEWEIGAYKIVYLRDADQDDTNQNLTAKIASLNMLADDIRRTTNSGTPGIMATERMLKMSHKFGAANNLGCTDYIALKPTPTDPITVTFSPK